MTANNTNKKAPSVRRKLIPATAMLVASAMALASSTYAWFTMSREVEVTGLNMTATVPEDLQISLGTLGSISNGTYTAETGENGVSLAASTGVLMKKDGATDAGDGNVLKPSHTWDWSNSADISAYYAFGRLIPASSTTGENIYYTPDANGVGKTVKVNASYYKANDALFARTTGDYSATAVTADATKATNARTTLHAYTGDTDKTGDTSWKKSSSGGYVQADDWKTTNDDGYYVDVPVWIRTSSNENVTLSVDGYVIPGTSWDDGNSNTKTETELELFRAVRVALLDGEADTNDSTQAGAPAVANTNIIPLKDAWDKKGGTENTLTNFTAAQIKAVANPWAKSLSSVVDSANLASRGTALPAGINGTGTAASNYVVGANGQLLAGVSSAANAATDPDNDGISDTYAGTYGNFTCLIPTSDAAAASDGNAAVVPSTVATIPGSGTTAQYGAEKKLIIRVWLDGEDGECWNDNAGQDWAISLKFSKIES